MFSANLQQAKKTVSKGLPDRKRPSINVRKRPLLAAAIVTHWLLGPRRPRLMIPMLS